MAKSCCESFRQIIKITFTMASICGANVMKPNYRMNWYTWFVILAIQLFFCSILYTIYDGFIVNGDWKVVLQTLSITGSGLQGYCKLLSAIFQRNNIVSMRYKLEKIYSENEHDDDYKPLLHYRIDFAKKMLKTGLVIYISIVSVLIGIPFLYGNYTGEKFMVLQFLLPGIDPKTDSGYWIQVCYQSFCLILGSFGNFAGDMFLFIVATHIPLLKDVIKIKCLKFNRELQKKRNPKITTALIKDILKSHCDYIEYVQQVDTTYFAVIFVQVSTTMMNICCTLFSIVIKSWPAGPTFLIYSFLMLYAYCGLGNFVDIANDEIISMTYSDILWYELTVPEQKYFLMMLKKSQKPIELTVGKVVPLSMASALQMTKLIYSFFMMLVNFLE